MPLISVIVNCFNGSEYLREALDSIYAQTFDDWEIVFWDNASVDESANIAREYDARLRYFRSEINTPLGEARNAALAVAEGEYVAFLDTDDVWLPSKLEKQVAMFKGNDHLGLVHTDVICLHQSKGMQTMHFAKLGRKPPRGKIFKYLLRNNIISMPSVMLRFSALRGQTEWFDVRFEIYPDFDLFRRISYEWEVDYVDEPLAIYRIHGNSSSTRNHLRASDELRYSIEKFRVFFPNIDDECPKEIAYLEAMVAYQRGKSLWREGRGSQARREFRACLHNPKVAAAWFLSWFSYDRVERIYMRLGGH